MGSGSGEKSGEKAPVRLPPVLEKLLQDGSEVSWFVFQVEPSLDWLAALEGARLQLSPEVSLQARQSPQPLTARRAEDHMDQLLPLHPVKPGSYKLLVTQGVQATFRISQETPLLKEANAAARKVAEEESLAERKRAAVQARARADIARERAEMRQYFNLSPLQEVFETFGLPLQRYEQELMEDHWDGVGPDPKAASREGQGDDAGEAQEAEGLTLHLKPLRSEPGVQYVPLVLWRLSRLPPAGQAQLVFRHYITSGGGKRRSQLIGQSQDAPLMLVRGTHVKRPTPLGFRYLVGGQAAGSKRVFIYEADTYCIERDGQFGREPQEDGSKEQKPAEEKEEELTYLEQRARATDAFGIAKRQRDAHKAEEKRKKRKFVGVELFSDAMNERAKALEANLVDAKERNESSRKKILPPWDATATHPSQIYKEGLETIAPKELLKWETELRDQEELMSFLRLVAVAPAKANDSNSITGKSRLLAAVIFAWGSFSGTAHTKQEVEDFGIRCEVLRRMINLYRGGSRYAKGTYKVRGVSLLAELNADSNLAKHWHKTYHDQVPGKIADRSFNGRRLLAAILVWALHLTPELKLEFNAADVAGELKLETDALKKWFENLGCAVTNASMPGMQAASKRLSARLVSPPNLDDDKPEVPLGPKKKGRH